MKHCSRKIWWLKKQKAAVSPPKLWEWLCNSSIPIGIVTHIYAFLPSPLCFYYISDFTYNISSFFSLLCLMPVVANSQGNIPAVIDHLYGDSGGLSFHPVLAFLFPSCAHALGSPLGGWWASPQCGCGCAKIQGAALQGSEWCSAAVNQCSCTARTLLTWTSWMCGLFSGITLSQQL